MTKAKFNRPHIIIPEEDTTWAVDQKPCVMRFWQQCWLADPYGSRWMKLVTNLSDSAFRFARRVLEACRLFAFRRISYGIDLRSSVWEVLNLHGARVKDFWQNAKSAGQNLLSGELREKNEADTTLTETDTTANEAVTALFEADILVESQSEQEFQQPSGTLQEHISNSSKELLMCEENTLAHEIPSSAQTRSLPDRRFYPASFAAPAPLGGASPLVNECVEKEAACMVIEGNENTSVMSCTTCQDSRDASQLLDRDNCSAAASPPAEKWSSDAIATRMQDRPKRQDKLKRAGMFGDNPGFDYLQQCWDDPSLRIMVRRLIARFPQWRVACVDEELVDWNENIQ